jgi:hypothetical protein
VSILAVLFSKTSELHFRPHIFYLQALDWARILAHVAFIVSNFLRFTFYEKVLPSGFCDEKGVVANFINSIVLPN